MDTNLAGQLLGVAPYTIVALEHDDHGWTATVKDMASHTTTKRLVPGTAPADRPSADPEPAEPSARPTKKAAKKATPKAAS